MDTEINKDVNKGDQSSEVIDATAASSAEVNKGSVTEKVEKQPTLAEVAQAAYQKSVSEEKQSEATAEGKAEDGSILSSNQTEKEGEKKEVPSTDKQEEKVEEKGKEEDKSPVPYERFQEVIRARQEHEAKVKEYEPLVQAHKSIVEYCQTNQITEEQFQQGMEMLKLVNTDPIAARKALEPVWNQLNGLTGETLPDDLAKEVEEGLISAKNAKELARLRGQTHIQSAKAQVSSQSFAKQKQAMFEKELSSSIGSWTVGKQSMDPEFKQKSGADAPDGKFEYVTDRFYKLMTVNPPKTTADAIRLVEQAYNDVAKTFAAFKPRVQLSSKGVSSTKSFTTSTKEPKSIQDVVAGVLAKHRA
jgi:hypothetical protein